MHDERVGQLPTTANSPSRSRTNGSDFRDGYSRVDPSTIASTIGARSMLTMIWWTDAWVERFRQSGAQYISRRAVERSDLSGYGIPRPGADVTITPWVIHHRAELWPDLVSSHSFRILPFESLATLSQQETISVPGEWMGN